jgi:succinate dehydrogenase / fumarate reductase membrane anchor subunit
MTTTTLSDQVTIRKVRPRSRPFESYAWLFMRLSGVSLILLAVGHMVMQHITHDVHEVTVGWVLGLRWGLAWIRVWDLALLSLAFVHGLNGFRAVVQDYIHNATALKLVKLLIIAAGLIVLLMGAVAIVFVPAPGR